MRILLPALLMTLTLQAADRGATRLVRSSTTRTLSGSNATAIVARPWTNLVVRWDYQPDVTFDLAITRGNVLPNETNTVHRELTLDTERSLVLPRLRTTAYGFWLRASNSAGVSPWIRGPWILVP